MGEVHRQRGGRGSVLESDLTNDIRKLAPGQGQYTLMCNGAAAWLTIFTPTALSEQDYLLIINASRIEADVAWLQAHAAQFTGGGARASRTSPRITPPSPCKARR